MANFNRILAIVVVSNVVIMQANALDGNFNTYYTYLWGGNHFSVNPQGTEVQLKYDSTSGAGFKSKSDYGSGLFHIRMKIPNQKTGGIVPNFYLMGLPVGGNAGKPHFEVDFEFLGTNGQLQTNVFVNDTGNREQKFQLWFDPSADFHTYEILWNPYQLVFYVDGIPIRVFKNLASQGVAFPTAAMHIEASIWNAPFAGKLDLSKAPFLTYYQDFGFNGCVAPGGNVGACGSDNLPWNRNRQLSDADKQKMASYRKKYMTYDYCADAARKKKECDFNNS